MKSRNLRPKKVLQHWPQTVQNLLNFTRTVNRPDGLENFRPYPFPAPPPIPPPPPPVPVADAGPASDAVVAEQVSFVIKLYTLRQSKLERLSLAILYRLV
jgi:hypothetical protein